MGQPKAKATPSRTPPQGAPWLLWGCSGELNLQPTQLAPGGVPEEASLPALPALDPHLHGLERFPLDRRDHLHIPPPPPGFGRISVGWFLQAFDLFYSLDSCGERGGGPQSPRLLTEGPDLVLVSGGNAERVSSQGQTAHSVEHLHFWRDCVPGLALCLQSPGGDSPIS